MLSIDYLFDVDDSRDDVRVDAVDVVGQHAVPEVVPDAVARRRLELSARPLLHQRQKVLEKTLQRQAVM